MRADQSLQSFFDDYFAPVFLRSRSHNTRRLYRTTLNNLERFLGRPPVLSDLNDLTINRYLDWFRRLPRSAATTNKERANALAIWRFACRHRHLDEWPEVEPEVEPERIPQAWLATEICVLFRALDALEGKICGIPSRFWWKALHLICWDTGERIGAVRDLRWEYFDLKGRWVLVPAELRKGKRKDRLFQLAPDTVDALLAMPPKPSGPVFPWPYCRTYIWDKYAAILEKAGLPTDRRSKFHRMRRSVASHFEARGGNATELLGHSKRSVTLSYLDPRIVKQKQASDVLFRPGEAG